MRLFVPVTISLALLLAACGSSAKPAASPPSSSATTTVPSGPTSSVHIAKAASNVPSVSAKMICETEAEDDIYQSATGVKTTAAFKPKWVDHVYSCDYVYPGGAKMTLSVKEVSNAEETANYFDSLAAKLGKTRDVLSLGEGAFQAADGSVVVRKDFKILLVDVTKLPAEFGVPSDTRGDVAINVAATIMGCWVGA
jgi:hypothetical protein